MDLTAWCAVTVGERLRARAGVMDKLVDLLQAVRLGGGDFDNMPARPAAMP